MISKWEQKQDKILLLYMSCSCTFYSFLILFCTFDNAIINLSSFIYKMKVKQFVLLLKQKWSKQCFVDCIIVRVFCLESWLFIDWKICLFVHNFKQKKITWHIRWTQRRLWYMDFCLLSKTSYLLLCFAPILLLTFFCIEIIFIVFNRLVDQIKIISL